MKPTSFLLGLLGLAALAAASSPAAQNWRQTDGVYEVYGITLEKFLELHPFTLVVIYNNSERGRAVRDWLPALHDMFTKRGVSVVVARMRRSDGPRWVHEWNVKRLPYFRFCVGDGVSVTTRDFADPRSVFEWVTRIYETQLRIVEVRDAAARDLFRATPNAFYLRFDRDRQDFYDMLTKFQMLSPEMRVFFATNPAYDVFDNHRAEDLVIGFRRSFEEPVKFLSSPDKLNADNIQRFFHSYREPAVVPLTEALLHDLLTRRTRAALYFGRESDSKVLEAFRYLAFEQKDNYLFVLVGDTPALRDELRGHLRLPEEDDVIRLVEFDGRDFRVFPVEGASLPDIAASFEKFSAESFAESERPQVPPPAAEGDELEELGGEL